jgi:hypothetical protein
MVFAGRAPRLKRHERHLVCGVPSPTTHRGGKTRWNLPDLLGLGICWEQEQKATSVIALPPPRCSQVTRAALPIPQRLKTPTTKNLGWLGASGSCLYS